MSYAIMPRTETTASNKSQVKLCLAFAWADQASDDKDRLISIPEYLNFDRCRSNILHRSKRALKTSFNKFLHQFPAGQWNSNQTAGADTWDADSVVLFLA